MLPSGVDWRPDHGEASRPIGADLPVDMEVLPDQPRSASDGTLYCVACPRTLRISARNQSILCTDCSAAREAFRARRYRRRKSARLEVDRRRHESLSVDAAGVLQHLHAIADLQVAVLGVVARRESLTEEWTDRLMIAAKQVDVSADALRQSVDPI